MIEIELHYHPPSALLAKILDEAEPLGLSQYTHTYYDDPEGSLYGEGMFLRHGRDHFELKERLALYPQACRETIGDTKILDALAFGERKDAFGDLEGYLDYHGILPFGSIKNNRESYRLDGITLCVDNFDVFGRGDEKLCETQVVVELERIVTFQEEIPASLSLIEKVAKRYGLTQYRWEWHKVDHIVQLQANENHKNLRAKK